MIRLVLPDAAPRDALDDCAAAAGLLLINIVPRAEAYPAQVLYLTPDRRAIVHLVDEGAGGALAWVVRAEGEGSEAVEQRWADALREAMARAGEAA